MMLERIIKRRSRRYDGKSYLWAMIGADLLYEIT